MRSKCTMLFAIFLVLFGTQAKAKNKKQHHRKNSERSFSNESRKKREKSDSFLLCGALGYERLTPSGDGNSGKTISYSGYGLLAGAGYQAEMGKDFSLGFTAGLKYQSVTFSEDGISVNITATTLHAEMLPVLAMDSDIGVGAIVGLDYLLSGNTSAEVLGFNVSAPLSSFTVFTLGPRLAFKVNESAILDARMAYGFGSMAVAESEKATSFNTMTFAAGAAFEL